MIEFLKCVGIFFCLFEIANILYRLMIDDNEGWEGTLFQVMGYFLGGIFLYLLINLIRVF